MRFREVKKAKPKYKEIEEKFQNEFEAPTLEERKKHLAELREFKRPIDRKKIEEHDKKYINQKKEQEKLIQGYREDE